MISPLRFEFHALYEKAYLDGYSRHGNLDLELENYANRIDTVIQKHVGIDSSAEAATSFFYRLHTNDLYLSVACGNHNEVAWNRFSENYRHYIHNVASFVAPTKTIAYDLAGSAFSHIFLPDASGYSRIASFDGQASLATWLRVIITRLAINERERKSNGDERLDVLQEIADELSVQKIEIAARASKYEAIIKEAFKAVSESLSKRERLIVLLRYEEALPAIEIARLLEVHPSTITRQLQHACKRLQSEFINILTSKHRLSADVIEECLAETMENPGYSILSDLQGL